MLDTHALLWYLHDDAKLSADARQLMSAPSNTLLLSPATYWELAIKVSLRKLILNVPVPDFIGDAVAQLGLTVVPIELRHIAPLESMPFHHRDPFDRLLLAQAIVEQIPIISADAIFDAYGVSRLW